MLVKDEMEQLIESIIADIDHVQGLGETLFGPAVVENDAEAARLCHITGEVHQGEGRTAVLVGAEAEPFRIALLGVEHRAQEQREE